MNIVIGHVALIQRTKRQDFVLQVISELRKKGHDVIGLFPGECREPDYKQELDVMVREHGLADSVLFLGRRNDIPSLIKLFDVLIIPSFEGFPLAGLEAASAGVPVVACDVAGAKEFVEESGGGLCFAEGKVGEAADVIEQLLANGNEISESSRKFAVKQSNVEYSKKIRGLFDKIM